MEFKTGQEVWVKGVVDEEGHLRMPRNKILYNSLTDLYDIRTDDKVTIPKFVAEWLDYCKARDLLLWGAFDPVGQFGESLSEGFKGDLKKSLDWIKRNQNTFARAWLDGYKVEKEKLYTINLGEKAGLSIYLRDVDKDLYPESGDWATTGDVRFARKFTEAEIKQDFAWAWEQKFYKEVE